MFRRTRRLSTLLLVTVITLLAQMSGTPVPCPAFALRSLPPRPQSVLRLLYQYPFPVITINSPGAEGIKYGFEGGRALKLGATYHIFTSELVGDPNSIKMKLAHWISTDRIHWKRVGTLFTSSGNFTGTDSRASLWAPMPVYNNREGRWDLFYVAYRAKPNTKTEFLMGYDGTIWRAVSEVKGLAGIGGPYQDVGIVLQPGKESESWEGLQGTDSFFPYRVGNEWYGFYGSAQTQYRPTHVWLVGLANAPQLSGPWTRCAKLNPAPIDPHFIENPVVTRLKSGMYVAVYDNEVPNAVGYTFSRDGIHWNRGKSLIVQPQGRDFWAEHVRTPLGLIPEGDQTFTLFYTGIQQLVRKASSNGHVEARSIGFVTVRLEAGP